MERLLALPSFILQASFYTLIFSGFAAGQAVQTRKAVDESSGGWWFVLILPVMAAMAIGAYRLWRRSQTNSIPRRTERPPTLQTSYESSDMETVDMAEEVEWFRKNRMEKAASELTEKIENPPEPPVIAPPLKRLSVEDMESKTFRDRMKRLQYAQLPINSFGALGPARVVEPLPIVKDEALLDAIDQANEEYEEDEGVRDLAIRILSAYPASNSVEALAQMALYDLSSNLRSKAVGALTDFDHPSVFEPILLACADPTREVRAAAARGLFRLSFNRADAWKRIIETNDEFRMRDAARAALESGIAVKSFDRLVHEDIVVAKEAFTLVAFLIAAGETGEIFAAIDSHPDERVKLALLRVLEVQRNANTLERLEEIRMKTSIPAEVGAQVIATIAAFDQSNAAPLAPR